MILLAILCSSLVVNGQTAVVASGNAHTNSLGSISWSLGEVAIHTLKSGETIVTQGFQQTRLSVTAVKEIPDIKLIISAYPNPANDYINLKVDGEALNLHYEVYNTNGKLIKKGIFSTNPEQIPFQEFNPAVYFIRVIQDNIPVKTFRVVRL